ncbi:MAG: hypothetical protein MJ252_17555 [archaeon]|nr:hypothetical protein [archaeon]
MADIEYDEFGDTRNKKVLMEEKNRYFKQSKNFSEKMRIGYIQENKDNQRYEQELKNLENAPPEEDEEEKMDQKMKNKRKLKRNYRKDSASHMIIEEELPKKKPKVKKPKKDRTKW